MFCTKAYIFIFWGGYITKMKYCSKCGNELFDEAVICPKCGCPTETTNSVSDKLLKANKHSKIVTATVLTVIAFGISIVGLITTFLLGYGHPKDMPADNTYYIEKNIVGEWFGYDTTKITTPGEKMLEWMIAEEERAAENRRLFSALCTWEVLYIATLILELFASKGAKKGKKGLTFVFMAVSVLAPVLLFAIDPTVLVLLACGIGFILFVPAILNLVAGAKLLQAAAINE